MVLKILVASGGVVISGSGSWKLQPQVLLTIGLPLDIQFVGVSQSTSTEYFSVEAVQLPFWVANLDSLDGPKGARM